MKKFFMAGTDDELQFGDMLSVELYKELEDGKVTREVECKFTEETVDYLLSLGVVEERDTEKDDLIEFEDCYCEFEETIRELLKNQASFEERLDALEKEFNKLKKAKQTAKK